MAREIKTRFVLEGEQQFKNTMKESANAIKVLNSEQKLAKAQFQQTGDAEKYNAQQAEILKKKIEEQKKAVAAAEQAIKALSDNGVEPNSRQMQQWQIKLNNASAELSKMETELSGLTSEAAESEGATDSLAESLNSLDRKSSLDAVVSSVGRLTSGLEAAFSKAKELATALVDEMREAAAWADELGTTAMQYQVDVETLQRMRYTADLIDTDVDTIIKSRQKLSNNMKSSSKDVQQYFAELGIITTRYGELRDLEDVFWETGAALMQVENEADQNAMAMALFGKSWRELIPLFKAGRKEYEEAMESQQVVSEENVSKLGALDDAFQNLDNRFETLKQTVVAQLAPAFTEVATALDGLLQQFNEYLATEDGKAAMQALSDAVHSLFSELTNISFDEALETAKQAIDGFVDGLKWIKENSSSVVKAVEMIIAAWAGLKVTAGIATLLQLVNGLKGLGTGKVAADGAKGAVDTVNKTAAMKGITLPSSTLNVAGQVASTAVMGGAWIGDFTEFGRALRDGKTLPEALAASAEKIKETFSSDSVTAFLDNWNPNSENANVIAKAIGAILNGNNSNINAGTALADQRAAAASVDASGADPALQEAWGMFLNEVNSEASTATADLLKDLSERYAKAFMGDWEDEPVIEALIDNLSSETGDKLSEALEDIANGATIDPAAAQALVDQVRSELADKLSENVNSTLTESGATAGANMATSLANGITANARTAIDAADAMATAVASRMSIVTGALSGMSSALAGTGSVNVNLSLGESQVASVMVPMMNNYIGQEISLYRG